MSEHWPAGSLPQASSAAKCAAPQSIFCEPGLGEMLMDRRRLSMGTPLIFVALAIFSLVSPASASVISTPASIQGLHVSGNKILNGANQTVRLLGVNRSGGEYMCVQGHGIWDGPADAASIQAMLTWKINAVRIPLNEDCWLAINGVNPAYSGVTYQKTVFDS